MSVVRDIALTEGPDGEVLAHRADCPEARKMAAAGMPVATMFGIQKPLPDDVKRHSCLEEKQQ